MGTLSYVVWLQDVKLENVAFQGHCSELQGGRSSDGHVDNGAHLSRRGIQQVLADSLECVLCGLQGLLRYMTIQINS